MKLSLEDVKEELQVMKERHGEEAATFIGALVLADIALHSAHLNILTENQLITAFSALAVRSKPSITADIACDEAALIATKLLNAASRH